MSARTGLKSMSVNQLQDNTPTLRKNTPLIGQSRSPLKSANAVHAQKESTGSLKKFVAPRLVFDHDIENIDVSCQAAVEVQSSSFQTDVTVPYTCPPVPREDANAASPSAAYWRTLLETQKSQYQRLRDESLNVSSDLDRSRTERDESEDKLQDIREISEEMGVKLRFEYSSDEDDEEEKEAIERAEETNIEEQDENEETN